MKKNVCSNMNHGRSDSPVRHCPTCGELLNRAAFKSCNDAIHAARRRERDAFCTGCGKSLRGATVPKRV